MIDRRNSGTTTLHTLMLAGEAVAWWLGLHWGLEALGVMDFVPMLPAPAYPTAVGLGILAAMATLPRLDRNLSGLGWSGALRLSFRQTLSVAGAVFTLAVGLKDPGISRIFLALYLGSLAILLVPLNRYQPGALLRLLYRRGERMPTLILGDASCFPNLREWLRLQGKLGLKPAGLVRYRGQAPDLPGLPVAGEFEDLPAAIAATGARQVLMLHLPWDSADADHLAQVCAASGCRLLIHNQLTTRLAYPLRLLLQDGSSFLSFQDEPLEDPLNRLFKRALDLALALPVTVLVLQPLIVVAWLVQRFQSPGPVLFLQPRTGRDGSTFWILKLRTMHVTPGSDDRQTAAGDPRVYPFGRFLRRTSLDELPQFLNVLAGQMSVVGPRPHYVQHDREFARAINEYRVRFFVKPGITGLAQAHGLRGELSTPEAIRQRLALDLLYIHTWSVWLDLTIIARTFRQVFAPPPGAR